MGLVSFFKKLFGGGGDEGDEELRAARARHGIKTGEDRPAEKRGRKPDKEPYNPWEDIDNLRRNFLMGGWASRKIRLGGQDKLREELEALERKREEERRRKEEEREN